MTLNVQDETIRELAGAVLANGERIADALERIADAQEAQAVAVLRRNGMLDQIRSDSSLLVTKVVSKLRTRVLDR